MENKLRVILQPVRFRKRSHVAVISPDNKKVDEVVREIEDAQWSTGYKYWHFPAKPELIEEVIESLSEFSEVDHSAIEDVEIYQEAKQASSRKRKKLPPPKIFQMEYIEAFVDIQRVKGYSESTLKVYSSMLKLFFGWGQDLTEDQIDRAMIQHYFDDFVVKNNFSFNYQKLIQNILLKYLNYLEIERE